MHAWVRCTTHTHTQYFHTNTLPFETSFSLSFPFDPFLYATIKNLLTETSFPFSLPSSLHSLISVSLTSLHDFLAGQLDDENYSPHIDLNSLRSITYCDTRRLPTLPPRPGFDRGQPTLISRVVLLGPRCLLPELANAFPQNRALLSGLLWQLPLNDGVHRSLLFAPPSLRPASVVRLTRLLCCSSLRRCLPPLWTSALPLVNGFAEMNYWEKLFETLALLAVVVVSVDSDDAVVRVSGKRR